ncbi:MAG: HAD family hydrolase [Clostridiales bacterium]|nr:HAD family hydrolase [Clostridiales bacterium]
MKTVLFDLDGTLLPMEQDVFTKAYFGALSKKLAPQGYEPKTLISAVSKSVDAMVANDGKDTNENVFWHVFADILGERVLDDKKYFDEFYKVEFNGLKAMSGFNEKAGATVKAVKARGCKVVVATNPVFPITAQENRLRFAGVDLRDVDYITSYENSHFCKPNTRYYTYFFGVIGCTGNDVWL